MLIVTRRKSEAIMIGDDIEVKILGIEGNQIKIGIDAPKETLVYREEIYKRIQGEKNGDNFS